MKVALVALSYGTGAGVAKTLRFYERELERLGVQVHVVAADFGLEALRPVRVPVMRGSTVLRDTLFWWKTGRLLPRLRRELGLDLIHNHHTSTPVQHVVTSHGLVKRGVKVFGTQWHARLNPQTKLALWREKTCLEDPTVEVTAQSKGHRQEIIEEYDVDPSRVHVTYSGVDTVEFHPGHRDSGYRERHGLPREDPLLLFVANEYHRKGLRYAIEALSELRRDACHLVVIGRDADTPYRRLAARLGVADRVHFMGFVPEADLPTHYASCDMFVLPTQHESFALVVVEALASGIPVAVTKVTGPEDLVEPGRSGAFIRERSGPGVVDAVREILDRQDAMRKEARPRGEEFTWARAAAAMLEVYKIRLSRGT